MNPLVKLKRFAGERQVRKDAPSADAQPAPACKPKVSHREATEALERDYAAGKYKHLASEGSSQCKCCQRKDQKVICMRSPVTVGWVCWDCFGYIREHRHVPPPRVVDPPKTVPKQITKFKARAK